MCILQTPLLNYCFTKSKQNENRGMPIREKSNNIKTNGVVDETFVLRSKIHNEV